ncbi:MAG: hypothetical protein HW405_318 [Candidatus Berkelbacteria bacterium]|nr:hypothetical protein [Candidatus Berkelbacteria bacterium]
MRLEETDLTQPRATESVSLEVDPEAKAINPRDSKAYRLQEKFRGPVGVVLYLANNLGRQVQLWVRTEDATSGAEMTEHCKSLRPGEFITCPATKAERVVLMLQPVYGGRVTGRDHRLVERLVGLPDASQVARVGEEVK